MEHRERFDGQQGSLLRLPSRKQSLRRGYLFHHDKTPLKILQVSKQAASCRFTDLQPKMSTFLPTPIRSNYGEIMPSTRLGETLDGTESRISSKAKIRPYTSDFSKLSSSSVRLSAGSMRLHIGLIHALYVLQQQKSSHKYLQPSQVKSLGFSASKEANQTVQDRVLKLTSSHNSTSNLRDFLKNYRPRRRSEYLMASDSNPNLLSDSVESLHILQQIMGVWSEIETKESVQETTRNHEIISPIHNRSF